MNEKIATYAVAIVAMIVVAVLSYVESLSGEAAIGVITAALGYVFGQQRQQIQEGKKDAS